ncbi:MAG: hypothetical protein A2283_23500 [Lentisphaerae bacterium RIFOXYA12_FULL_48_11]|nr:MAG: hypothetical protein A2283_23500 [Lentisphaerae bacterium RIFOXYA12_FULL_48_11]
MRDKKMLFAVVIFLSVCISFTSALKAETADELRAKALAVLKSDAPFEQKSTACRDLVRVGNRDCVPVLAGMLGDEQLSHMARYALEPMPDKAADEALRAALDKLSGKLLSGVIGSIGARRDSAAVELLGKYLCNSDCDVVRTTAMALGRIGTAASGKVLLNALKDAKGDNVTRICDGLLTCGANLLAEGREGKAKDVYDGMLAQNIPARIRAAALRGAVLCDKSDSMKLLTGMIHDNELCVFGMALRVALEMEEKKVTGILVSEIGKVQADRVIPVVRVLGKRGDKAALPALLEMTKKGDKAVRVEAIQSVAEIGDGSAVPVLVELMKDADAEISQAAATAMAGLPGSGVDTAIVKMIENPEQALRVKMIDIAGQRRIAKAKPALLKDMSDSDLAVRTAAVKSYGELAGMAELPVLIDMMTKASDAGEIGTYERVLGSVCSLANDKDACAKKLIEALVKAAPAVKPALLKVLGVTGGAEALKAVRTTVDDADKNVHLAAIRVLSEWKTVEAVPVLLDMAKNLGNETDKLLSLRGCLSMAMRRDVPEQDRIEMCKQASGLIQRDEEKRMMLGALGSIKNAASLKLVMPYLDNEKVRDDAINTVLAIVEPPKKGKAVEAGAAREALQKVVDVGGSSAHVGKAREMLKKLEGRK